MFYLKQYTDANKNKSMLQVYRAKQNDKWLKGYIVEISGIYLIAPLENAESDDEYHNKIQGDNTKTILTQVEPSTISRLVSQGLFAEVYSGDVVDFYMINCTALIVYTDGCYFFHKKLEDGTVVIEPNAITELRDHLFNVIDNIYDNPSLLKDYELEE